MSFDQFAFARAVRDNRDISSSAKAVAVVSLMLRRNAETGSCMPGIDCIKSDVGLKDERSVYKALNELEAAGIVLIERSRGKANSYVLVAGQAPTKNVGASYVAPTKNAGALNAAPTKNVPAKNVSRPPAKNVGQVPTKNEGLTAYITANRTATTTIGVANKKRAPLVALPDELPNEWMSSASEVRPDVDPCFVYGKLKARYVGTTTRKAITTWRREYLNWVGREFARSQAPVLKPVKRFTDEYYAQSLNPDGTVNWGI